jgi:predicted TIM-barrel fold metal-dependent hydrolase
MKTDAQKERNKMHMRRVRMLNPERERERNQEWASKNTERKKQNFRNWWRKNRAYDLWRRAKKRAEISGLQFDITSEQLRELIALTACCPYTRVVLDLEPMKGFKRNPWAPSIDRIDSSKGYTLDNIEITSLWWNLAKNEWSPEVMRVALDGLRSYKA